MATPNMGLVLPTDGGSDNVWDTILDTVFGLIDSHGHVAGQGVPIVSAALSINADVPWGGFSITGAKALTLAEQATSAVAAYADAIFVNSADHNLYFRNAAGTNVQITSGSTLNVSIVGGIGGDYSSVSALLSYDDATKRYLLQQEVASAVRPWAGLATADIDLYEKALLTGSPASNKVTLKSPHALAASYAVTMPAALPASTAAVQMSSTGALSVAITKTRILSIPAFAARLIPSAGAMASDDTGAIINFGTGSGASGLIAQWGITLPIGAVITGYTAYLRKISDATCTAQMQLEIWNYTGGAGGISSVVYASPGTGTEANANNGSVTPIVTTLTLSGITKTVTAGDQYHLSWISGAAQLGDQMYQVEINYTEPSV